MRRFVFGVLLTVLGLVAATGGVSAKEEKSSTGWTGARLYEATCARCHAARPPVEHSDKRWKIVMGHMRVRANLTAEESQKILEYLQNSN
ncbi:MAG: cytochrome c [Candidatus Omnitrophica bacterium]|nr:cytochrome c [Candidatus Omnitrophota bacterium]